MSTFDFIVVGSGPAGSVLASRLAKAPTRPSVLLLEAGGPQPNVVERSLVSRWTSHESQPHLNWGYASTPQVELNGRALDISRGKGLGGSSTINFLCWTMPNRDAIEEWRERIGGDELFGWEKARMLMDGIVKYSSRDAVQDASMTGRSVTDFATVGDSNGSFSVEYGARLKKGDVKILESVQQQGYTLNKDMQDGDTLGFGIAPAMADGFLRTLPAASFLADAPSNLVIKTDAEATRILFEGKTAMGVEVNGQDLFHAKRCVVLSAGAINTPKLLMLSGVGPAEHLEEKGIPVMAERSAIGRHLKDHFFVPLLWEMDEDFNGPAAAASIDPSPNQDLLNGVIGFERDEAMLSHPDFSQLPMEEQCFLKRSGTPTFEIIAIPHWVPGPQQPASNIIIAPVFLTPQTEGSITLASADWRDAPNIDLNVFGDGRGMDIEAYVKFTQNAMRMMDKTPLSRHVIQPMHLPASDSDEDVSAFVRANTVTIWHPCCTAKMGPPEDKESVVDPSFRVNGLENLRLADLSVAPVLPTSHPVTTALLVGAWAAERMIEEYKL